MLKAVRNDEGRKLSLSALLDLPIITRVGYMRKDDEVMPLKQRDAPMKIYALKRSRGRLDSPVLDINQKTSRNARKQRVAPEGGGLPNPSPRDLTINAIKNRQTPVEPLFHRRRRAQDNTWSLPQGYSVRGPRAAAHKVTNRVEDLKVALCLLPSADRDRLERSPHALPFPSLRLCVPLFVEPVRSGGGGGVRT